MNMVVTQQSRIAFPARLTGRKYNVRWLLWRAMGRPGYGDGLSQACAFMLWMGPLIEDFKKLIGDSRIADHDAFTSYIYERCKTAPADIPEGETEGPRV